MESGLHQAALSGNVAANYFQLSVGILKKGALKSPWFTRLRQACKGSLMLVATLTATISFQVAFIPPGGVWQQTYYKNRTEPTCRDRVVDCIAGNAVLAYVYPRDYFMLIVVATVSFIASMSLALSAISGLPLKNKVCTWLMTVSMIVAITFTTLTYLFSMLLVTPDHLLSQANKAYNGTFYIWLSLLGIVALFASLRLLLWRRRIRPKFMSLLKAMPPTSTSNNNCPVCV